MPAPLRREALLAAAEEVFARKGYHGASLDDIAHTAGVSKALIYEHFASKRELHASLVTAHVAEIFRRLEANAEVGGSAEERLRGGIDAFLSFVEEHREAWRALFRDAADPEAPGDQPQAIEMHAALLSGGVQSLANWWHDHQDVPRVVLVNRAMDFCWVGIERLRVSASL